MKSYDWKDIHSRLMRHYRLRTLPIVLKYYEKAEEMLAIPRLTHPDKLCTPCLAVGQAVALGAAVAVTSENFNTNYCRAANGFAQRDEKWYSAEPYLDRWSQNLHAAQAHHKAMTDWGNRRHEGFAVAPLEAGVIDDPDCCLMYVNPEQAFWVLTASVNVEYKKRTFTFLGESTCSDSWMHTVTTGEPGLAIGSNGERVFGGLPHDEMILTLGMEDVVKSLEGMENIRNGREFLAYPMPGYGSFGDISCTPNPAFAGF